LFAWYGQIRAALKENTDVVLRLDVQGAATMRKILPGIITIFLVCVQKSTPCVHESTPCLHESTPCLHESTTCVHEYTLGGRESTPCVHESTLVPMIPPPVSMNPRAFAPLGRPLFWISK
jgi:hypothetical protein